MAYHTYNSLFACISTYGHIIRAVNIMLHVLHTILCMYNDTDVCMYTRIYTCINIYICKFCVQNMHIYIHMHTCILFKLYVHSHFLLNAFVYYIYMSAYTATAMCMSIFMRICSFEHTFMFPSFCICTYPNTYMLALAPHTNEIHAHKFNIFRNKTKYACLSQTVHTSCIMSL